MAVQSNLTLAQCMANLRSQKYGTEYGKDTIIRAERDSMREIKCAIANGAPQDGRIGRTGKNVVMINIHRCVIVDPNWRTNGTQDEQWYYRLKINGSESKRFSWTKSGKGEYGTDTKAWAALCAFVEKTIPAYV